MKLIYSTLKKFIPTLDVPPQQLRDDLTLIGHFANYYEMIGEDDFIIDLDIKVNRGDCLGYYGLARELSVFYNLPLVDLSNTFAFPSLPTPNITINSPDVYRVLSCSINNLKVSSSPQWLTYFLAHHGINSVNNLVDLSNYIMLLYSIPCHTFDSQKSNHQLTWENISKPTEFATLDRTTLDLQKGNLVITNGTSPISLSFIGGYNSGIDLDTTKSIIEMAVYNRSRVRSDSRSLKTITEAGTRLEKDLDTDTLPLAFNHLVSLITEVCQGQVDSGLFDYYPAPYTSPQIEFNLVKPSIYAGIDIPTEFARDCLIRLGCQPVGSLIIPPSLRRDLTLEEDLIEEVIRFYGYDKIPTDQPLTPKTTTDITPPILNLIEKLKDNLVLFGYDEVRSWPLVSTPQDPDSVIATQNSINSEYPYLRQSIIQSLKSQQDQYSRLKLLSPKFFEIGKVFHQHQGQYQENYALGVYSLDEKQVLDDLSQLLPDIKPTSIQPTPQGNFLEFILDGISESPSYQPQTANSTAIELTTQLINLDANVNLPDENDPQDLIIRYSSKIDPSILWEMLVTDIYHDTKSNQYRYTFRVTYYNCTDKQAKEVHLRIFDLH